MIGYFIRQGDNLPDNDIFINYLNNYDLPFIKKDITSKKYGLDLDLILVQYHISGELYHWEQIRPRVLNYSSKEKAIGVVVGVKKEDFIALSHQQKKQFFVDTTRQAILDIRARLEKKKLDIDFDSLLKDLDEINKKYLESE